MLLINDMQKDVKKSLKEIFLPIENYLQQIDGEIISRLTTGVPIMDGSSLHLFKRGGKKIRPAIVILCSGLNGTVIDDVIPIAAAVEIVHAATLIHDDIIDQTLLRRGDLTVSNKWGEKIAVLIGDFMLVKALDVAFHEKKRELYPEIIACGLDMIKGELYQMQYSNIENINKEHYFNIIELKTARFMGNCARAGGIKADLSEEENKLLFNFGLNIGYAFQIVDDTLDYVSDENMLGKDIGNDLSNGKITLPFLHMLEMATDEEKKILKECAKSPDKKNWEAVKTKIKKYDAVEYSLKVAEDYIRKAIPCLDGFKQTVYKEKLIDLANFFISRDY